MTFRTRFASFALLQSVVLDSIARFLHTQIPYLLLSFRYKFFYSDKKAGSPPSVVISLTSYPARYKFLRKTLISLLLQESDVNFIIHVNLWTDEYRKLPKRLFRMQSDKLKFFEIEENMRVFLKLLPTMRREPLLPIVTADDDIYYKGSWLKNLYDEYLRTEFVAIGYRACLFEPSGSTSVPPYSNWPEIRRESGPSPSIFLTGVGGVLYPPRWFSIEDLDYSMPQIFSPGNDDLWYYFLARSKGQIFKKIFANEFEPMYWLGSQRTALWRSNVSNNVNDDYVRNLLAHFKY